MNKICTDIKQSQRLIELGIDINTADMYYQWYSETASALHVGKGSKKLNADCPAWSLSALMKLMPDEISIDNETYYLYFTKKCAEFGGPITWDGQKTKSFKMDNILDSAFEMICWLLENKKL